MNQQANQQQPAAPYDAATLDVHDNGLVFSREFGTNTTDKVGDAFVTTVAVEADPTAFIDARFAMLDLLQNVIGDDFPEPRGRTFVMPDWSTFVEQTNLGAGIRVGVVFTRLMMREAFGGNAQVIMAPLAMVGHQPALPFVTLDIAAPTVPDQNEVSAADWLDGPSGPNVTTISGEWGNSIYARALMFTDNATLTDVQWFLSRDGISWTPFNDSQSIADVVRRVGISLTDNAFAQVDFLRVYSPPFLTAADLAVLFPVNAIPRTGGRLYVP